MKTVGILIERQRTYGRRLCQGIVRYAQTRTDWALKLLTFEDLSQPSRFSSLDGLIARVLNDEMEARLRRLGKPVVDVFSEKPRAGFASVDQNARLVGQLAARHFIEHRFTRFAFCGYDGRSYSDRRRDAFAHCLRLNHFDCTLYASPRSLISRFDDDVIRQERLGPAPDRARLAAWLKKLEKPVAVFCSHDLRAYQLIELCRELGLRVPDDVAVLGVDDDELVCNFTTPVLSSIDQNALGIGFAAAETLAAMMETPGLLPEPKKIRPRGLVERGSTRVYPLDPPWLSDALVFIRGNVARRLSATDVYSHVGKSHTLVDSAFRQKLGTSVQKEINRVRLAEAKRLVLSTSLPFNEIAARAGFASQQYFCTSFLAAFGRSPSAMRG